MRLLNETKPKYFLLENVMMGEKWEKILSKAIGVKPIMINSALVSAQNRQRLYWTNIGLEPQGLFGDLESIIEQPKDKGILLKHILEEEVDLKYFLSDKFLQFLNNHKDRHYNKGTGFGFVTKSGEDKGNCLRANAALCPTDNILEIVAMRGRPNKDGINIQQLESRNDNKTNCLTSVQKDNLVRQLNKSKESGGKQPYQQNRIYDSNGISPALCAHKSDLLIKDLHIRRLTPIKCERLQTVKDNYTNHVSDSQRYKMLGNGWTVDVIAHFFKYMK
jgi:DNA (cytosine-5)-methyltransferase 3A